MQTGNSMSATARGLKPPASKLGPRRFDPFEHGGVKKRGRLFLFCGVLLPAVAMLFETNFHFCARHFFDPFPSAGHVVLFGLIPFSNFLVWLGTRRDLSNHYAFMALISGMAMGVACLYTLMFLPLTPMACLFSLVLGFGLLGLAPLLSLPCNLIAGSTVRHLAARKITYFNAHQVEHLGHMIILVMVIAIELPSTLTRINLSRAAQTNPSESRDGVAWLRRFGSQEVLLRACYERSGRATDILGSLYDTAHPLNVTQARRVFFQVTGKPFNSVPIPQSARATVQHTGVVTDPNSPNAGIEDEFDVDTDIAGEAVSGVARGLSVSQSKIEGKIDADAALATLGWSFAFTNDSKFDREARAKILLPPSAVVTKATLTVNNIERSATIMVRNAARDRYRRAVVEHKDPLLVSTCGTDQVLVQCFPVRPGQTIKVKLQMAAPLDIDQKENATQVLPAFLERNFQADLTSSVNIQSTKPLTAGGLTPSTIKASDAIDSYCLTGNIDAAHLAGFNSIIEVEREKSCQLTWCKTEKFSHNAEIERRIVPPRYEGIKNLIVVVDASASMQRFMPEIAEGLKTMPPSKLAQIKVVGDTVSKICPKWKHGGDAEYISAVQSLKKLKTEGGQDDFSVLSAALNEAAGTADTAVLWLHAAQPVTSGSKYELNTSLGRATAHPILFDMQLVAGPNEILNGVITDNRLVRVPRAGSLVDDLSALFLACERAPQSLTQADMTVVSDGSVSLTAASESNRPPPDGAPNDYQLFHAAASDYRPHGREVDERLAKIWANRQICTDIQYLDFPQENEANLLANAFQIVSPVSSAIVTEPVAQSSPILPVQDGAKQFFSIESLDPRPALRQAAMSLLASTGCIQAVGPIMPSSSGHARYGSANERFRNMETDYETARGRSLNAEPSLSAESATSPGAIAGAVASLSTTTTTQGLDHRGLVNDDFTFAGQARQMVQDAMLLGLVLLMSPIVVLMHIWILPILLTILVGAIQVVKSRIEAKARAKKKKAVV
jgi:hypothetical protein